MAKQEQEFVGDIEVMEILKTKGVPLAGVLAGAEIDSQIATAKRYPRNIGEFKTKCLEMATIDQETAASCYYMLPRAGRNIEGPSVRLAEIAMACYRNCVAQGDVSHEDGHYMYAVGMARDLENNVAVRVTVRRRITDHNGKRYNDDMITVTANAAVSIALRNAIFKIVPGAYIRPVFEQCKQVAAGKAATLEQAKRQALAYLAELGVTDRQVLATLHRKTVEDITKADIITLRGFCTAIRDSDATVETIFGNAESESATEPEPEKTVAAVKPTRKATGTRAKKTNLF